MDLDELVFVFLMCGIALVLIGFVCPVLFGLQASKAIKSDDEKKEEQYEGKILEKAADKIGNGLGLSIQFDWIIFEDHSGQRKRFRNVRPTELILAPGDEGKLLIRGETIYGFEKWTAENREHKDEHI